VALGLFIGEYAAVLQPIGDGFVMLLQMAVLPYFFVTLVLGLGSISFEQAKLLGLRGAAVLATLWSLCFLMIFSLPLTFPDIESASFFSTSSVQPVQEIDFLKLYIPANPFNTLASGVLPGVVVFGLSLGVALIGVKEKTALLETLSSVQAGLIRITQFVVRLTPIGVFALAAAAAGTMTMEEVERLQVYLVIYTAGALILTLWLAPMLVSAVTPFSFREVFRAAKDPLVTGFTTGNLLVVLPLLTENIKALFHSKGIGSDETDSLVGVTVPISYPFPDIGTLLIMVFVPFAAWFSGSPLTFDDYPGFSVVGFFSFFGSVEIGMPFLLDQLRLPSDMFELYLMTLFYIGRFATLVAVIHIAALAAMTTCAVTGVLRFNYRRLAIYVGISVAILGAVLLGLRAYFGWSVSQAYTKDQLVASMRWLQDPMPSIVQREVPDKDFALPPADQPVLDAIRERGVLRVGYVRDALPYSFFNTNDELVGFDVEMAQLLATDIGVQLEFVPFERHSLLDQLNARHFDIAMAGIVSTPPLAERAGLSDSYLDVNLAVVVEDHRRKAFDTMDEIRAMPSISLGVVGDNYLGTRLKRAMPQAEVRIFSSPEEFFDGGFLEVDALVMSAQAGSAWTLLYPRFSAVVPRPLQGADPLVYVIRNRDRIFTEFVNRWIEIRVKDGTVQKLHDHWFLGKDAGHTGKRWSVIRDVLGWVE
ncbi:MAG: cation:dicarboxylase symporter family transporter, partial [Pseudomonadota bacterium]